MQRPQEGAPEQRADSLNLNHLHQPEPLERGAAHTPDLPSPGGETEGGEHEQWTDHTTEHMIVWFWFQKLIFGLNCITVLSKYLCICTVYRN